MHLKQVITIQHSPFPLDIRACPDIVLAGKDKFVIKDPFRFMVKASAGMKLDNLIIFDSQIMAVSLQMSYLK
jgi:hypothetical protein